MNNKGTNRNRKNLRHGKASHIRKKKIRRIARGISIQPADGEKVRVYVDDLTNSNFEVIGVRGGVIEPTEIDISVFSNAIASAKAEGTVIHHSAKMSFSEEDYGEAWSIAKSKIGEINLNRKHTHIRDGRERL